MLGKNITIGLFAVIMLVGASTASAQASVPGTQQLSLSPNQLQPGGTIVITLISDFPLDFKCGGRATSPGFVAPIEIGFFSHTRLRGEGRVIQKPGTYTIRIPCDPGNFLTGFFTIVGSPSTRPPTNPSPTNPPPTVVKPKGAPQTGGGGTAANQFVGFLNSV